MLTTFYCQPKSTFVITIILIMAIWILSGCFIKRYWKQLNIVLAIVGGLFVLYVTLLKRTPSTSSIDLRPFISFVKARENEEFYRTMILNSLLFLPFGLGIAGTLEKEMSLKRLSVTMIAVGFVLSFAIETIQYMAKLGMAETDDVIFNVLGMVLAVLAVAIEHKIKAKESKHG